MTPPLYWVFCDGAIEPRNPGGHAVGGWVAYEQFDAHSCSLGTGTVDLGEHPATTNNQAEFSAVHGALKWMHDKKNLGRVVVHTDSMLVVKQLSREWGCGNEVLKRYRDDIWKLAAKFASVTYTWIPREQNEEADTISRSLYARNRK